MRNKFSIIIVFLLLNAHSICAIKPKDKFINAYIYSFTLPFDSNANYDFKARVLFKGKPFPSQQIAIANTKHLVSNEFVYVDSATNKIGTVTLPFNLKANRFYWLIPATALTHQATNFDELFTIQVYSDNPSVSAQYNLPQTFNIVSDNALNITYLQTQKENIRNQIMDDHAWILSVSTTPSIIDSTIIFNANNKLPKGIQLVTKESLENGEQQIILNNCYVYEQKFYMPITYDYKNCNRIYTTSSGKLCSMDTCINTSIKPCNYLIKQNGKEINLTIKIKK